MNSAHWGVRDFSCFKGFGPAKSIAIMAALELGKRRKLQEVKERAVISCSKDIYELFHPLMCDLEAGRVLGIADESGE